MNLFSSLVFLMFSDDLNQPTYSYSNSRVICLGQSIQIIYKLTKKFLINDVIKKQHCKAIFVDLSET